MSVKDSGKEMIVAVFPFEVCRKKDIFPHTLSQKSRQTQLFSISLSSSVKFT